MLQVLPGNRVCVIFYDQMSAFTEKAVLDLNWQSKPLVLPYRAYRDEYDVSSIDFPGVFIC